jgi:hypothetical protein
MWLRKPPHLKFVHCIHRRNCRTSPNLNMGAPFDFAPERPEHIDQILNGLDRYNPETTGVFQDYVMQQCESQTYDCYANLALLKLYVFLHLRGFSQASHDE